ncbi:hypothetical protein VSS37_00360 [Candidatus Thiothrix sp. Deng01]|uniref:Uncharacterized protein n=1 Tax=Candidatus Thiothrix phosphatis TaxID=3112415 RepID=A0ABU6CRF0_9GAMM|nr:hypothetical protein [Candidatus Thiothrix sp. Deng01]MEB4589420.1 hypothetical protein [Candidatus Thiothrix sp. Deng01]
MPTYISIPTSAQETFTASPSLLSDTAAGDTQSSRESNVGTPATGLVGLAVLPLISQLLQQFSQQQDNLDNNTPQTPASPETPEPEPVALTDSEQQLLNGLYAADGSGAIAAKNVVVLNGANTDQRLNEGDTLIVQGADGNEILHKTLTTADLYDLRFRESMLDTVSSIGSGWEFSENLVHIKGTELTQPETRAYTTSGGQTSTETVLERNNFWEVVQRGSNRYLLMRETDNSGNAVLPSDAINDIFDNRQNYAFDCATPMRLLNLKATLDTIGVDDFNGHAGRLLLSSWYDQHDASGFDGGFITTVRTAQAGEINVNGVSNLNGESALFDPTKGDTLTPGAVYYFDLPGDKQSASQGWNAVYIGRNEDGTYRFWSTNIGTVNVHFQGSSWLPEGTFDGYYLGAINATPNTIRLQDWDADRSV